MRSSITFARIAIRRPISETEKNFSLYRELRFKFGLFLQSTTKSIWSVVLYLIVLAIYLAFRHILLASSAPHESSAIKHFFIFYNELKQEQFVASPLIATAIHYALLRPENEFLESCATRKSSRVVSKPIIWLNSFLEDYVWRKIFLKFTTWIKCEMLRDSININLLM